MSDYFRPYEGKKPFAFISYSHHDSDRVLDIISPLHVEKYRVWYDEGIPAGGDWSKNIDQHLRACAAVLFFISASSLASENCLNEIKASFQQKKAILCLRLDDTILPPEWERLIAHAPTLDAIEQQSALVDRAILEQGTVSPAFLGDGTNDPPRFLHGHRFNVWTAVSFLGVLLVLSSCVGAYGLSRSWFDNYLPKRDAVAVQATPTPRLIPTAEPTIQIDGPFAGMFLEYASFAGDQQERAIRDTLGQEEGDVLTSDLLTIKQLHVCGNMTLRSGDGIAFDPSGNCSVNSAPVMQGSIADLSTIADLLALEKLSLVCQQITSIDELWPLQRLVELNVAGNPITRIGDLSNMVSLQTLHLEHTKITDLSPLGKLSRLKTVTLSAEMFPLTFQTGKQSYDVVLVP